MREQREDVFERAMTRVLITAVVVVVMLVVGGVVYQKGSSKHWELFFFIHLYGMVHKRNIFRQYNE